MATAQPARVNISLPSGVCSHVSYQLLDKYSYVDSVALDAAGNASLYVECAEDIQYMRLIVGREKLPMILHRGDTVSVMINPSEICKSEIVGSAETAYLLRAISCKNNMELKSMMRRNPGMEANLLLAEKLDPDKDLKIMKAVAADFADCQLPAAEHLRYRILLAESIRRGQPVPQFSITGRDGNTLSTGSYAGEEFTIYFWAQWCRPSALAVRRYQMIKPDRKLMSIEIDENFGYFDNEAVRIFGVTELPLAIEVDRRGRISRILKSGSRYQTED